MTPSRKKGRLNLPIARRYFYLITIIVPVGHFVKSLCNFEWASITERTGTRLTAEAQRGKRGMSRKRI